MELKRLFPACAAVSLIVVSVLAACGGGSEDRLTKEEFLTQGNAICSSGDEKIGAAAESTFGSSEPTQEEIGAFASETIVPTIQDEIDQLRDLSPPKEDEDQVNAMLDEAQSALDNLKANPELATQGGGFEEANRLAKDYGLTACAD